MFPDLLHQLYYIVLNQWTWWWEASSKKDEIARAILTASVLILVIFFWTFFTARKSSSVAPLPPGPRGLPIVGYLPFLGTNLHHSFAELAHQYGPIWKIRLGYKLCVVVSSPSLAKEVVRDQHAVLSNRDPTIASLAATYGGNDIAFAPSGSYWRNMRKVFVRDMLSNSSLESSYNLRRDEVRKAVKELHKNIGAAVDIGQLTFQVEFNIVVSMMWGSTFDSQKAQSIGDEFRGVTSKIVELLGVANVSDFFPVLARFDLQRVQREMKKLVLCFDRILEPIIDARLKLDKVTGEDVLLNKGRKDFLQILLELKDQQTDTKSTPLTVTQIKALMMDIVVGGTDTSATTVEWVMTEIMNNPEVMKKVQEELADVVGMNNVVEESHLPDLRYLDAVVKETQRLHPAFPLLIPRSPSQSCIVGGYTIPKDTRVFLNVWALHRDPELWENSFEFKPERFLSDTGKWDYSGNNFQYLPFGSGRRMCAGLPLAEKMVMYVLASLLHSFNWDLPDGEVLDLTEKFGIIMKKSTPLKAIPTQRLSNMKLYE